jgi:hypothetical protein
MDGGSGPPAAICFKAGSADRGWPRLVGMQAKAAPTIKPTPLILSLSSVFGPLIFTGIDSAARGRSGGKP